MSGSAKNIAGRRWGVALAAIMACACGGKETNSATTCDGTTKCSSPEDAGTTPPATCSDLVNVIAKDLSDTVRSVGPPCQSNDDCVEVPLPACLGACVHGYTSKGALTELDSRISLLDQTFCPTFTKRGCSWKDVPCRPRGTPGCLAGLCVSLVDPNPMSP